MDKKKYATYTDINEEHLTWDIMKLILDNSFDEIYVLDHTGKIVYKGIEIKKICALYKELKSSYKVAKELNISQSKATRIVNKYLKNKE